jgi:nitroreductase
VSRAEALASDRIRGEAGDAAVLARVIRGRRTIHEFTGDLPPRETILAAIDLARWAPNHHATEPWHFYLLGPETAAAIAKLNSELVEQKSGLEAAREKLARWSAIPGWLVVTCDRSEDAIRAREDYAACCCTIHNLQLYLWSEGIGVKWTTGAVTRSPAFYDLIWVDPEAETLVGLLWYGYAREVPMTARKEVDEFLVTLP